MTKGVRKSGRTLKDAERRRLAKRTRAEYPVPGTGYSAPAGWAVLWCDGGSRGNPGPAAYGYVLEGDDGAVVASAAAAIGTATVGTAEYRAVVAGLEAAASLGLDRVEVRTDSRLVVSHMGASPPALRNPRLSQLRERTVELQRQIGTVTFRWIPSEQNGRADRLVSDLLFSTPPAARGAWWCWSRAPACSESRRPLGSARHDRSGMGSGEGNGRCGCAGDAGGG